MSFNIVDLVKDQLTEQVTGYIGNMLGGNASQTTSALDGAIPSILGGLMDGSSTSQGAGAIFDTLDKQDDGILDNLGDLLSGDNAGSLMSMGSASLGSLLGGNNNGGIGSIIDAVSGFAGSDKGATKSMMGLLAPIIFSVIKKQLMGGNSGFNVGSLVDMFTGQKDNITASIPNGFNINPSTVAPEVTFEGKSALSKMLPLLLVAGAGWLAYNFFTSSNTTEPIPQAETKQVTTANLGQNIEGTMTSLVSTLGGIKDVNSAKAALSTLTNVSGELGNYAGMLDKVPAESRSQIVKYVMDYVPQIKELLNKAGTIPGVGAVITPIVEKLSANLALFQ